MFTYWMDEKLSTNIQQPWNKPYTKLQKYAFGYLETLQIHSSLWQTSTCFSEIALQKHDASARKVPSEEASSPFIFLLVYTYICSPFISLHLYLHPKCGFPQLGWNPQHGFFNSIWSRISIPRSLTRKPHYIHCLWLPTALHTSLIWTIFFLILEDPFIFMLL